MTVLRGLVPAALLVALVPASASAGWYETGRTIVVEGPDVGHHPAAAVFVGPSGAPPPCELCPSPMATSTRVAFEDTANATVWLAERIVIEGEDPADSPWVVRNVFQWGGFSYELPQIAIDEAGRSWLTLVTTGGTFNGFQFAREAAPGSNCGDFECIYGYVTHPGNIESPVPLTLQPTEGFAPPPADVEFVHAVGSIDGGLHHLRLDPSTSAVDWFPIGAHTHQTTGELIYDEDDIAGVWPDAVGIWKNGNWDSGVFPAITASGPGGFGTDLLFRQFFGESLIGYVLENWANPTQITSGIKRSSLALKNPVVGTGQGDPAVAWTPASCTNGGQLGYRQWESSWWGSPEAPPDSASACAPTLAFNDSIEAHVAFEDRGEDNIRLTVRKNLRNGAQWQTPETIGFGMEPEMVYDPNLRQMTIFYYDVEEDALVAADGHWY